jgi:hypothetical protein
MEKTFRNVPDKKSSKAQLNINHQRAKNWGAPEKLVISWLKNIVKVRQ